MLDCSLWSLFRAKFLEIGLGSVYRKGYPTGLPNTLITNAFKEKNLIHSLHYER